MLARRVESGFGAVLVVCEPIRPRVWGRRGSIWACACRIGITTWHLTQANRTWGEVGEGTDDFAEGDDKEELALGAFRYVIIRYDERFIVMQHW